MDISATGQKVFDYALQGTPLSEQGFFISWILRECPSGKAQDDV